MKGYICLVMLTMTCAAVAAPAERTAKVDDAGVLRWQDDGSEVCLFGVNYYTPFSIDYAAMGARGLDREQAIHDDVTHLVRLGLSAIRLHCWDREISDKQGNLIDNEHLRLLDMLIAQCKQRGIYSVMTPIAWWGSPEGEVGFSSVYSMHRMTTDREAWQAQARYLVQYLNHVNRYTKLAYKDDPAIVALELINEPIYPPDTPDSVVTEYINTLCAAVRSTGCAKPIFYNCWGPRHAACAASRLDGVTFGWYPTGLVSGGMLKGDYLGRVDDYAEMREPVLGKLAKIVYEFDSADVHGTVMYPAMARSFRGGGAQIACQFQYDLMALADRNPNWQTHYLNLVYTPQKALSFAIAAEAFRRVPRLARFGSYPESSRFGDFRLDYAHNLSELAADDAFLYANTTETTPPHPEKLTRVWGYGSSPLVRYDGAGAYFLDRLGPGRWQLQVYPDAVMVDDPYRGGNSEKVRVLWDEHAMEVRLPDLKAKLRVRPGTYLLSAGSGAVAATDPVPAFVAPPSSPAPPTAFIDYTPSWREGKPLTVRATVAATGQPDCALHLWAPGASKFTVLPMTREAPYQYSVTIPSPLLHAGTSTLAVTVQSGGKQIVFPGGQEGPPAPPATAAPTLELLNLAASDQAPKFAYSGPPQRKASCELVAGRDAGTRALRLQAEGFGEQGCISTELPIANLPPDIARYNAVRLIARGGPDTPAVEISLGQSDGNAFGRNYPLGPAWHEMTVPLASLVPMWQTQASQPDLTKLSRLVFVAGAWYLGPLRDRPHSVEVQSVKLVRLPDLLPLQVAATDAPFVLVRPSERHVTINGHEASQGQVPGMDDDTVAFRVLVDGFGPPPDCAGYRLPIDAGLENWREEMAQATCVVVKARAVQPQTSHFELVLIERDGTPWGTMEVPLTTQWQAIKLPLSAFRCFTHWRKPPEGRGGPDDHLRPGNVQDINVCFGAWLYGEDAAKPHGLEIQDISLE